MKVISIVVILISEVTKRMIDPEIRATVSDLIKRLQELPEDAPITLICHENDGHHINWEEATISDVQDIGIDEYGVLNIGVD